MKTRSSRANTALVILGIAIFESANLYGIARAHDESDTFGAAVAVTVGLYAVALGLFAWNIATYKRSLAK